MNNSISIIVTCHNKDNLIGNVIQSIIMNTSNSAELIIVFDGCTDNSEKIVDDIIKTGLRNISSVKKIYTPDVFETKANNIGMKIANGNIFILVQDDMVITEKNWDIRIIKPIITFNDVISVTAKTAHNIKVIKSRFRKRYVALDFSDLVHGQYGCISREHFFIRDTANRGPLALDAKKVRELNFLDEKFAPYNWDEHDLNLRAYSAHKWVSGCYWVKFRSDENWGTTRNKNKEIFTASYSRNARLLYSRHKKLIEGNKHNEERFLADDYFNT